MPTPAAGGSIDFKWLPSTVKEAAIYKMNLTGGIDTWVLPREFNGEFTVKSNCLEGSFDTAGLPRKMYALDISHNQPSGVLDFTALPP